jgi:hypothetical protein
MDLENNYMGRIIGQGLPLGAIREFYQAAVLDALNAGQLTILEDINNNGYWGLLEPSNKSTVNRITTR